jgi:hypothetical protein
MSINSEISPLRSTLRHARSNLIGAGIAFGASEVFISALINARTVISARVGDPTLRPLHILISSQRAAAHAKSTCLLPNKPAWDPQLNSDWKRYFDSVGIFEVELD